MKTDENTKTDELPKPFGARFAEIAKDFPCERICWVMVRQNGEIQMGGDRQVGKAVQGALQAAMRPVKAKPAIVAPDGRPATAPRIVA